jgi:outer membrane phospholipase A
MTEYNLFCYSIGFNDKNSFQQARYRAFNKAVGEKRYNEIKAQVENIIPVKEDMKLSDFWASVTQAQWKQLLAIPEASDFLKGFEYISTRKIEVEEISLSGKEVSVTLDGKTYKAIIK